MIEQPILDTKNLKKKRMRFHLIMIFLWAIICSLVFWKGTDLTFLTRLSLKLSTQAVAIILIIFHIYRLHILFKHPISLDDQSSIVRVERSTKRASSVFQVVAIIGLLLILVGIFVPPLARIVDSGIPLLAMSGIEFLVHAWMLWIVQEYAYRLSR